MNLERYNLLRSYVLYIDINFGGLYMNPKIIAEILLKYRKKVVFLEENGKEELVKIEDLERMLRGKKEFNVNLEKNKIKVLS